MPYASSSRVSNRTRLVKSARVSNHSRSSLDDEEEDEETRERRTGRSRVFPRVFPRTFAARADEAREDAPITGTETNDPHHCGARDATATRAVVTMPRTLYDAYQHASSESDLGASSTPSPPPASGSGGAVGAAGG